MSEKFKVPRKITPEEFYQSFLPRFVAEHLAEHPDFRQIEITVAMELTGDEELGGTWRLRLSGGRLTVDAGRADGADVVVTQDVEDWREGLKESNGTPIAEIEKRLAGAAKRVEAFKRLNGSFAVEITREDEPPWRVLIRTGNDVTHPGPVTTISLPDYDYDDIREGRADPLQLLMRGKIKVQGDKRLAREVVALVNRLEG